MPENFKVVLANSWLRLSCGFILLELISFVVFPYVWLSRLAFILILIAAATLASRKLEYGAYLLLAELIVGGLGYLISYPLGEGRISLRLGLFIVILIVWLAKFLIRRDFSRFKDWRLAPLAVFFIIFIFAVANGYFNDYPWPAIFADFNGYLYFALFGLFLAIRPESMRSAQILFIGSLVLGLKTLTVLFLFSHGYAAVNHSFVYTWLRDTGTGEITLIAAPLFRIFFQSHFYNFLALVFSAYILLFRMSEAGDSNAVINSVSRSRRAKSLLWLFTWFNFFILVVSQSRSFWVAGLAVLVFIIPAAAIYFKISFRRIAVSVLLIPAFAIISNSAGQMIIGDVQTNFFTGRVGNIAGSAGVSSRLAELAPAFALIRQAPLLGNGFGATIRFRSDDPRLKNFSNPEGWTDAAAIEWGYLDLAVKAGVLGLLAYLVFLFSLAWPLWKLFLKKDLLATGLLAGLLALIIVNMFTPYLNHPLGIGYLLAIVALTKKSA